MFKDSLVIGFVVLLAAISPFKVVESYFSQRNADHLVACGSDSQYTAAIDANTSKFDDNGDEILSCGQDIWW